MRYAETGYNLEIDLSTGNIEKIETDPGLMNMYIGGQGPACKILYERVPPEVDAWSPANLLIFSPGLLDGTLVPGANRTIVNTISPQTNYLTHSMFGGYWGPELKFAGYDRVIIRGKAKELVYIYINNDHVEIRDAAHLAGKGAIETQALIKKELGDEKVQVVTIGLAGENRVFSATIEHANSSASRLSGVVMGDKRLKAIAVRGTKDINVARPEELQKICIPLYREIFDNQVTRDTMELSDVEDDFRNDNYVWGKARKRRKGYRTPEIADEWHELGDKYRLCRVSCFNCPIDCHQEVKYLGMTTTFTKCFPRFSWTMGSFTDREWNYKIMPLINEYGVDGFAGPQVLTFAIELYEAGILTDEDLPDFPSDGGDRFFYLLDVLVHRKGFVGDALAQGIPLAAKIIGKGAEKFDHNAIKGTEQVVLKLGVVNMNYFLMSSTGEKLNITQIQGSMPQWPAPLVNKKGVPLREKMVKEWDAAPERFKKWFMEWEPRTELSKEATLNVVEWNETMHYIDDALGTCAFLSSFRGQYDMRPPLHINNLPAFLSHATGMDVDSDKLWLMARRNRMLVRAINNLRGMRRVHEKPPADHWKVRNHPVEQEYLDDYYEFRGWNNDGVIKKETLEELGLDYMVPEFEKRGIWTEKPSTNRLQEREEFRKQAEAEVKAQGYGLSSLLNERA